MDKIFGPGGTLQDDPFNDIRIPYAGQLPPPGYTLFHDSLTYFSHDSNPFICGSPLDYYRW